MIELELLFENIKILDFTPLQNIQSGTNCDIDLTAEIRRTKTTFQISLSSTSSLNINYKEAVILNATHVSVIYGL